MTNDTALERANAVGERAMLALRKALEGRKDEHTEGLRASAARLRGRSEAFTRAFFGELYGRAPQLRALFPTPEAERRKLGAMLAWLAGAGDLEALRPAILGLGERHAGFGADVDDYAHVVEAFLHAVRTVDDAADDSVLTDWRRLVDRIVPVMRGGHAAVTDAGDRVSRHDAVTLPEGAGTLYEELGGEDVIERVHTRLYEALFADEWIGWFFHVKSMPSLIMKQTKFMVAAFGGPDEYRWESPAIVHLHMYITAEQADIRETLLRNAIRAEGLSQSIEDRWLATDRAFRPAIVKGSIDETVMRLPGQLPVKAERPVGYRPPALTPRTD